MAFTSAPWKVYQPKTSDVWVISAKGYAVCRPQNPQDAELIAAAPELFEACKIKALFQAMIIFGIRRYPMGSV